MRALDVTVFVADGTSPGTVKITAAIRVPPATTSAAVTSALASAISTAASASDALGLIILNDPAITKLSESAVTEAA